MKLVLASSALAAAALLCASPASAAAFALGTFSAPATAMVDHGNSAVTRNGSNSDTYTFTLANTSSVATSILANAAAGGSGQFDFTSVFITGGSLIGQASYTINPRTAGSQVAVLSPITLLSGSYTLTVNGTVSGAPAFYSGNITFSPAVTPSVPEPATWAMMMLGFGSVGYVVRRRPKTSARMRFA